MSDDTVDELKERIQELEDELQNLKEQKRKEYADSAAVDEEIEEVHDQIRDEADQSGMSRRKFMKTLAGGGAALGAAAMMPSAAALDIESKNPLSYNSNFEIDTEGNINLYGRNLNNIGSVSADESSTELREKRILVPSEYPTVRDALNEIRKRRASPGLYFDVHIESGHQWQSEVTIQDENLQHVSLTAADSYVSIPDNFESGKNVLVVRNARGPTLEFIFDGTRNGGSHDGIGIYVDRNATLRVEGGGAENFLYGLEAHRNGHVYSDGGSFDNNSARGISVTRNSSFCAESNTSLKNNGDYNVRCGGTGYVHLNPQVTATGAGKAALQASGQGRIHAPEVDISDSEVGINARSGFITARGITGNNITGTAIRNDGGIIDVKNGTFSTDGIGIYMVNDGGITYAKEASFTTGAGGVIAEAPGKIDARDASISGSGANGIFSKFGAKAVLDGATVSGYNSDLIVRYGGMIFAENCATSSSSGQSPHSNDASVSFNSLSGEGVIFAEDFEAP